MVTTFLDPRATIRETKPRYGHEQNCIPQTRLLRSKGRERQTLKPSGRFERPTFALQVQHSTPELGGLLIGPFLQIRYIIFFGLICFASYGFPTMSPNSQLLPTTDNQISLGTPARKHLVCVLTFVDLFRSQCKLYKYLQWCFDRSWPLTITSPKDRPFRNDQRL